MIIETIFSTLDGAGRPNFAPMGVLWGEEEMTDNPRSAAKKRVLNGLVKEKPLGKWEDIHRERTEADADRP